MRIGVFRFSPRWWAWLVYLIVVSLLLNFGAWQLRRAHDKEAILAAQSVVAKAGSTQARDLVAHFWLGGDGLELRDEAVRLSGRFLAGHDLLQDSQVFQGQVGYHVWTPLVTKVGLVLVNRGWVPASLDRQTLPENSTPTGLVALKGQWRGLPRPGFRAGEDDCDRESWPRVVQYPRREALGCLLEAPVKDGIVLLDAEQPYGFGRDWVAEVIPPAKHYGYAFQWFAMALALTVIFIVVNVRREQPPSN